MIKIGVLRVRGQGTAITLGRYYACRDVCRSSCWYVTLLTCSLLLYSKSTKVCVMKVKLGEIGCMLAVLLHHINLLVG